MPAEKADLPRSHVAKSGSNQAFLLAPVVLSRFLPAFLIAATAISLIVFIIYGQHSLHQQVVLEQEVQHVLDLQHDFLLFEFQAVQSDLLYLANQQVLHRFLAGDAEARGELEHEYVSFTRRKAVFDHIRCIDTSGQEIVRVNYREGLAEVVPQEELQSKATRYYFQQALSLRAGEVFISPFDLNVEHGQIERPIKPVIRFLTPVFDNTGQKRAFLVFNYLGARLLSKLKQISAGSRGQSVLVNSQGEYLQAPEPRHEWGWLLDHPHSFRSDFPAAWDHVQRMEIGKFRTGDNLFTVQRVSPGRRSVSRASETVTLSAEAAPSSLYLVSFVSSDVARAQSKKLLNQLIVMSVGVLGVVALLLLYWARSGVIRRYHERRIVDSEARLRQLSSMLLAAQENERRNLSRDLHDELGQQVTAISLDLRSLEKKGGGVDSGHLLQRAIEETDQLLKSLHEIATKVRPSVLDDLGLQDAIDSLLTEYQQRTGIEVRSQLSFGRREIPAAVGENVYRILQEALANVATHAEVGEADVRIETDDRAVRMIVRDPGIGFEYGERRHSDRLGILGMRERVELLDGQFDLQSTPGAGTQITVMIPLTADKTAHTAG